MTSTGRLLCSPSQQAVCFLLAVSVQSWLQYAQDLPDDPLTGHGAMAGKYYDELEIGMRIEHELARTLTDFDNILFSSLTLNTQPLHINADFASKTEFGKLLMNGLFTLGLCVGITVNDLTAGTIIANLGYEQVKHPHPMFAGDTLYVVTEIIDKRESQSRPNAGIITLKHSGHNQNGVICIEVTRSALFLRRPVESG